jgi:hypothetical protein
MFIILNTLDIALSKYSVEIEGLAFLRFRSFISVEFFSTSMMMTKI